MTSRWRDPCGGQPCPTLYRIREAESDAQALELAVEEISAAVWEPKTTSRP